MTTVTKKASTQDASQSSSKGNENDKEVNPRKNDSSTRVSSKLSSLQTLSTVISLLEGEAGRFADRWLRPEYHSLFFAKATLRCIVETFLRRLSKHAAE